MYSTGTVTTTANSTKLTGVGTKWLNNINRVSAEQAIQIQIGTAVHNNSIQSIQSDTELTLNFPIPTAATGAKYVILTTMVHSVSDAMNKIVSMNVSNVQFSDILTRWMTEQGIITVTLPDQTTQQLRTTKEMDKQLDGKLNITRPEAKEVLKITSSGNYAGVILEKNDGYQLLLESLPNSYASLGAFHYKDKDGKTISTISLPGHSGLILTDKDYYKPTGFEGYGGFTHYGRMEARSERGGANVNIADDFPVGVTAGITSVKDYEIGSSSGEYGALLTVRGWNDPTGASAQGQLLLTNVGMYGRTAYKNADNKSQFYIGWKAYTDKNTTKDSNGNLKAASPV
ncbi:TPA: hypothetical protein ACF3RY_006978, partial [Pseudomonas aeruginosa]